MAIDYDSPLIGIPVTLLVLAVLIVCLSYLFRYLNCWNRLEKLYSVRNAALVKSYLFRTVSIVSPYDPTGMFGVFRRSMKIGIADAGVYLAAMFPATLAARPVLIPWNEFTIVKQTYIGYGRYELTPVQLPEIQIILPQKVAEELLEYLESRHDLVLRNNLLLDSQRGFDPVYPSVENRKQRNLR